MYYVLTSYIPVIQNLISKKRILLPEIESILNSKSSRIKVISNHSISISFSNHNYTFKNYNNMEAKGTDYLGVELKIHYFNEFILSGIPVPPYTKDRNFILRFNDTEHYKSYTKLLKIIFIELELADPQNCKYEIQRSKIFIRNLLVVLKEQAFKSYD